MYTTQRPRLPLPPRNPSSSRFRTRLGFQAGRKELLARWKVKSARAAGCFGFVSECQNFAPALLTPQKNENRKEKEAGFLWVCLFLGLFLGGPPKWWGVLVIPLKTHTKTGVPSKIDLPFLAQVEFLPRSPSLSTGANRGPRLRLVALRQVGLVGPGLHGDGARRHGDPWRIVSVLRGSPCPKGTRTWDTRNLKETELELLGHMEPAWNPAGTSGKPGTFKRTTSAIRGE